MSKNKKLLTILFVLVMLAGLVLPISAEKGVGARPGPLVPFPGEPSGGAALVGGAKLATVGVVPDVGAALIAGANYVRHAQADVTEDNALNGTPDADPNDGGWDWVLTAPAFTHSSGTSEDNLYGETAKALYCAYLKNPQPGYMVAMQDAATKMVADSAIRTSADDIFLMLFQDLPGVTANIYKDAAKAKYDARIAAAGSATLFAQNLRDTRGITQGYPNGIIPWDIGAYVVAAQMLYDRYGAPYDTQADDMAEVLYQDSFNNNPGLFNFSSGANEGWDPTYTDKHFWWYTLGVSGLIDAFRAANVHTDKLPDLVAHMKACQFASGAFSGSYGANTNDEDWQTTGFAVVSLATLDAATYRHEVDAACYWLAAQQDPSGGFVYSDNTHYPLVGADCTVGLYYGQPTYFGSALEQSWAKYSGNPVLTGSAVFDPCVIKDSLTYKMWYTHQVGEDWTIWYAQSTDGITWTDKQQVLAASGVETRVAGPSVILDGGTYKMWYSSRNATGWEGIGYATSLDGKTWTKAGTGGAPLIVLSKGAPGTWDSQIVREPSVIKDGSTYKMWYSGCALWPVFKIGYAESSDGITWVKSVGNPIFIGTPGGWDGFQVYAPSVVKDGSTYHMFFSGTDGAMSTRWSLGYASSGDGLFWAEGSRNPILIPNGVGDSMDYAGALKDGGVWKVYYSEGGEYTINLATLGTGTELYFDPAVASIPNDHATTKTYTIRAANVVDLYGYQFQVQFDPAKLEATAAAFDDSFFPPDSAGMTPPTGWNATISNTVGTVSFARTHSKPQDASTGSGPLATVTFRSKDGAAINRLDFVASTHILGDKEGFALAHTTQHAWLTTYGTGTLQGSVNLQGRSNKSGAVVTIMSQNGYLATTTTDAAGAWQFTNIPATGYQVNVEMARYLDAQKGDFGDGVTVSSGGTTTLATVKLLGGDAIEDDHVDISDLGVIAGVFGTGPYAPPSIAADINDDGYVNILDLVLAAGNYDLRSPVPWS